MSYHGKQYKGASRDVKKFKREEAERRNELTPDARRRKNRR